MDWLLQLDINDAILILRKELLGEMTVMANVTKIAKAQEKGEVEIKLNEMLAETQRMVETLGKLLERGKSNV